MVLPADAGRLLPDHELLTVAVHGGQLLHEGVPAHCPVPHGGQLADGQHGHGLGGGHQGPGQFTLRGRRHLQRFVEAQPRLNDVTVAVDEVTEGDHGGGGGSEAGQPQVDVDCRRGVDSNDLEVAVGKGWGGGGGCY